jgi:hypothetical protein
VPRIWDHLRQDPEPSYPCLRYFLQNNNRRIFCNRSCLPQDTFRPTAAIRTILEHVYSKMTADFFKSRFEYRPRGRFLDEIQTKVLRIFLLAIHIQLYSFALRFISLQAHATSYSFCSVLLYTVKEKGGKPDSIPYPSPLVYEIHTETSSLRTFKDAEKSQRNCTFMNSALAFWGALH